MDFSQYHIMWLESCVYPCECVVDDHIHNFFHYIYCVNGTGVITIAGKQYEFMPGYIYLTPHSVEHGFLNNGSCQLKTIEIKFSIDNPEAEKALKALPICVNVENYPIKSILSAMYEEHYCEKYLTSAIIELNFKLLLNYLLQIGYYTHDDNDNNLSEERFYPEIDRVIKYIYEHLDGDLSLQKLSEIAGFEKKYFSRKFKKVKNLTPVNFVRQVRIKKAKELLRYSDMSVTQIAEATGFKSIHYFSKQFYECMGMRPLSYKNSFK